MIVHFVKSNPEYPNMIVFVYEDTISLCKGSTGNAIVTAWAKADRSVPNEDEVHDIISDFIERWQDEYSPSEWGKFAPAT
jgi:hypothetical protein